MKPNEQAGSHQVVNGKTGVCVKCKHRGQGVNSPTYCGIQAQHVPRKGSCYQFEGRKK